MTDPDTRPVYEQIESVRSFLKQGGPRKIAMQELQRIALLLRGEAIDKAMSLPNTDATGAYIIPRRTA